MSDYKLRFNDLGQEGDVCVTCGIFISTSKRRLIHHEWHNDMGQLLPDPAPAWERDLREMLTTPAFTFTTPEYYGEAILERIRDVAAAERANNRAALRTDLLRVAARAICQYRHTSGDEDWMPTPGNWVFDNYWERLSRRAYDHKWLAITAVTALLGIENNKENTP